MALRSKIQAAVDTAFAAANDLVVSATLASKNVSGYDFTDRSTVSTSTTQVIDVIIETKQRASGDGFNVSAIMKSGVDLSVYDTLTVGSTIYNIVDYSDNDFVITASLVREVS